MKRVTIWVCALALAWAGRGEADIFAPGGFFIGCNYWAKHAGMYMWSQWEPETVRAEVEALARYGVTVMRVFPLWSDFQPLTGDCDGGGAYRSFRFRDNRPLPNPDGVDDEMLARFRTFCDIAASNRVQLVVGLVTGWMSGRQFVPSVFEERNVLANPEAVRWQIKFVRRFVRTLKDHPAIAAWDYGNECNVMGAGAAGQAAFYNWMDHLALAIRAEDPVRPIVSGMHGLSTHERAASNIRQNGEIADILCTHPYAFYVPGCGKEAFNTLRTILHPTAESLLYRDLGGKPCFVEEIGNLGTSCTSDARTAAGVRATLFSAWANDLKGLLWWCNSDQEGLDFPPYTLTPFERELGMLRQDFSPKPVMLEMQAFQRFRASLPFARLPAARVDCVIVVPEKEDGWIAGFGAYLLARQAGLNPRFAGAEAELPAAPLYLVASANDSSAYTFPAQKRLYAKVASGARVLLFYSGDMRFTRLHEHAGVTIDYCAEAPITRTAHLASAPARTWTVNDRKTCRLLAGAAEVLASTTEGEPALTRYASGAGALYVCNGPLDRQAVERTDVLAGKNIQPYYLAVREVMRDLAPSGCVVKGDCPQVVLTEHPFADGTSAVIAINCEPRALTCPITLRGRLGRVWRGEVSAANGSGMIRLAPNEAAVFEVVQ